MTACLTVELMRIFEIFFSNMKIKEIFKQNIAKQIQYVTSPLVHDLWTGNDPSIFLRIEDTVFQISIMKDGSSS